MKSILSACALLLVGFANAGLAPEWLDCKTTESHWDYWWYGASDILHCQTAGCSIATSEAKTVSWSVTEGINFGFSAASVSIGATSSYTYGESVTSSLTYTINYNTPGAVRLWRKQWFSVNTVNCLRCYPCQGIGCKVKCDIRATSVNWVPCSNGNCIEYQVSDANAQCNSANKCSEN